MDPQWNSNFTTNSELAGKQLTSVNANTFCVFSVAIVCLKTHDNVLFDDESRCVNFGTTSGGTITAGVDVLGRACPGVSIQSCR